jgi:hypothetical protein
MYVELVDVCEHLKRVAFRNFFFPFEVLHEGFKSLGVVVLFGVHVPADEVVYSGFLVFGFWVDGVVVALRVLLQS